MKIITSLILALLLLFGLAVPALAAAGSVSLAAFSQSLKRGDSFTVTASLSGAEPIALGTVKLDFDSSVFELTGGSCHVAGAAVGQVIPGSKAGTFMLSGEPQKISGTIFTFNMKVKDTAGFGSFTISSSASVGVSVGEGISSGSVVVSVVCDHSYGEFTGISDTQHSRTCSVCKNEEKADHSWDKGVETKKPTCKEEGEKTFTCSVCKATRIEKQEKSDDHTFGKLTSVDDKTHKDTCSVCQKEIVQEHTWNKGTVTKKATCKEEGEKTFTCTGCGATKTEKLEKTEDHTFGKLTSVDDKSHKDTCSVCKKEIIQAHTWNRGTVTKKATCKEEGEKTFTCTGCGATKTEVLPKSETHKFSAWKKISDTEHKRTCSVCDLEETGTHSYKTTWSKDDKEHWHACSVCKDKKDAEKHQPGLEPTETEAQTCKKCDYILKPALGHTHSYATTWTTDESGHWYVCAGCEEKGSFAAHDFENDCDPDCAMCGFTRETDHSYSNAWESDGTGHWHACAGCGEKTEEDVHLPGAAATAEAAQTCTVCGYELAPALGEAATEPGGTIEGPTRAPEFPWWLIPLLIAGLALVALILVLKKQKR